MSRPPNPPPQWRNRVKELRYVSPRDLADHPHQWREHPDVQRSALRGVLEEIGIAGALLAYESPTTGVLTSIDGHLRKSLGDTPWPTLILDVTDEEAALLLASHDPLAALAETNRDALATLLQDVQSGDAAVQQMLSDLAQREGIVPPEGDLGGGAGAGCDVEPQLDRAEELRHQWGTELGQLWTLGQHKILCGDCTDKHRITYLMGDLYAQMIFTDPPYGVEYDGGIKKRRLLHNDNYGTCVYADALPILAAVVDDQAPLYLWYADAHAAAAAAAAAAAGYIIVAQIIWAKNHAQFVSSAHYHGKHEPCYYAHKKNKSARWYGATNEVTLWEYDRAPSNNFHPTQKPVPVAERAIKNSTTVGDIILDGFLGGGTTLIACENLGRRCYGCEIDPGYVAVSLQRWADLTGETPTRVT